MKIYYFPIVASLIFIFLNLYVLKSLQNRFISGRNFEFLTPVFWVTFLALNALEITYLFSLRLGHLDGLLYKLSVATIAVTFMVFCISALFDLIDFLTSKIKFSTQRRKFAKFSIDAGFVVAGASYVGGGFYNGFKNPIINEVEIYLKNLKNELNLAVATDIHLGKFLDKSFLEIIIESVNLQDVDGFLIVGDMFDLRADELGDTLAPLKKLKTPCFFVLGNHEYYSGAKGLIDAMKEAGVRVLENENVKFKGINLAGVYDRAGYKFGYYTPNLDKALEAKDDKVPTALMAHQPKYAAKDVKDEVDLVVCGHTHGGQIFPFSLLVRLDQVYVKGLYNDGKKQIFVSSGAGFWGPPVRMLSPSEIAILKLKKG